MSGFEPTWWPGAFIDPLSRALIHFLWQGGVVSLALLVALRLTRKVTANLRYGMAVGALALMALLPILTFSYAVGVETPAGFPTFDRALVWTVPPSPTVAAADARGAGRSIQQAGGPPWDLAIVTLWFMGLTGFSAFNAAGWFRVRTIRRHGVRSLKDSWGSRVDELRRRLGIRRRVAVLESPRVTVLTLVGWLRPMILIPTSALLGLSPQALEALLFHELAHVRRHDYLVNLLQAAVEGVLFYHPAVWWVSRQVRREREHCCDDLAVAVCDSRRLYLGALADMESLRHPTDRLALAASGGVLLERIRRLIEPPPADTIRTSRWWMGMAAVGLVVMMGTLPLVALTPTPANLGTSMADPTPVGDRRATSGHGLQGTWEVERHRDGVVLVLRRGGRYGHKSTFTLDPDELTALDDGSPGFELRREAGIFFFTGEFDGRRGRGSYTFEGNENFVVEMRSLGYDVSNSAESLYELALFDVTTDFARGLRDLGYDDLSMERLVEFRIHRVSLEFIEELQRLGYDGLPASRLVEFRIHGVSPDYIRELRKVGLEDLNASRLVEFRIHGVSPEFVREMNDLGLTDLGPGRLVEFRIHGVSPEFIREMNNLGLTDLSPGRLVEFRIHGVTPEFVRKVQSRRGEVTPGELVSMRIHGWEYE